jgi:hypothetical protein
LIQSRRLLQVLRRRFRDSVANNLHAATLLCAQCPVNAAVAMATLDAPTGVIDKTDVPAE